MWICANDGFVSIVQVHDKPDMLLVRARRREHLAAFIGTNSPSPVEVTPGRDYRFRAVLPRSAVAEILAGRVLGIDYGNFKDSVKDARLHRMYSTWWADHRLLQPTGRAR